MQLYALDEKNRLIGARQAEKQYNYRCIECQQRIRLRGGLHRQPHFYHLEPNAHCGLDGKGMVHIQTQCYLLSLLPPEEGQLEYRFSEIKRIADVAWLPKRRVFEIQCAPISAEEVRSRNRDYRHLGWEVVWVLHDKRYNQKRVTAAEMALRSSPYYFTNFDQEGNGFIYDQIDIVKDGLRIFHKGPFAVDLASLSSIFHQPIVPSIRFLQERLNSWPLYSKGDLLDLYMKGEKSIDWVKVEEAERQVLFEKGKDLKISLLKKIISKFFVYPYRLFLQTLLERSCK